MLWSISQNGGTAKSPEQWGLTINSIDFRSQSPDVMLMTGAHSDPIFAFGDWIVVQVNGNTLFQGRVNRPTPAYVGNNETVAYEVMGSWWYLDNLIYEATYYTWGAAATGGSCPVGMQNNNGQCFIPILSTHAFLNVNNQAFPATTNDVLKPTGWQIRQAVQFAVNRFAGTPRLQLAVTGSGPGDITDFDQTYIAYDEVRDITCAEVIRKMMRWSPNGVTWIDHTTTPPTFRAGVMQDLPTTTLGIGLIADSSRLQITPRYDMVPSKVVIQYEQNNIVDGFDYINNFFDVAPSGASSAVGHEEEFLAMRVTVDLFGVNATTQTAVIATTSLPTQTSSGAVMSWWAGRQPNLNVLAATAWAIQPTGSNYFNRTAIGDPITGATGVDAGYGNELLEGEIMPWMPVSAQRVQIDSTYDVTYGQTSNWEKDHFLHDEPTLCNVNTGGARVTYTSSLITSLGEPVPTGLANALWSSVSAVQYEGQIEITDIEVGTTIHVGQVLNITGGESGWATMGALVQEVQLRPETGQTIVKFGLPGHLTPQDFVAMLRVNRWRHKGNFLTAYGFGSTSPTVQAGQLAPKKGPSTGGGWHRRFNVSTNYAHSDPTQVILLDSASAISATGSASGPVIRMTASGSSGTVNIAIVDCGGQDMKIAPVHYTDPSGTAKTFWSLHSPSAASAALTGDHWDTIVLGGAGGGGGCQQVVIDALHPDYFDTHAPAASSTNIPVAKQPRMRQSLTSETIDGLSVTYTYATDNQRTALDGAGNSQIEVCYPRMNVGDTIYAIQSSNGTTASAASAWTDNTPRVWARRYIQ